MSVFCQVVGGGEEYSGFQICYRLRHHIVRFDLRRYIIFSIIRYLVLARQRTQLTWYLAGRVFAQLANCHLTTEEPISVLGTKLVFAQSVGTNQYSNMAVLGPRVSKFCIYNSAMIHTSIAEKYAEIGFPAPP